MPTQTVQKVKSTKTCRGCGGNVAGSATKCQNCGSSDLMKSLVIVRKSEMTGEDAHAPDPPELESEVTDDESADEDDDEYEDLDEDEFEAAYGDEDEDDEDDEEDEDDSEDDDAEEDDEEEDPKVTKRIVRRRKVAKSAAPEMESVNLDIYLAAFTAADEISKAIESGDIEGDDSAFETAMTRFNNVCDAGAPSWANGESIAKEDDQAKLKRLKARVAQIRAMLKGGGGDDEDDDVEKRDNEDIFKGMPPAAVAILKRAQEIQERDTIREFEEVAKSFEGLATPTDELGAALRSLKGADETAYETVTKTLRAASEAMAQSTIFKTWGSPQEGIHANGAGAGDNLDTIAKSIMGANSGMSESQAYAQALAENPHLYDAYLASR